MGSIYKHTYTTPGPDGTRVRKETRKWYIEFVDENGVRRREPGFKDRRSTEQLLATRERDVEMIRSGLLTPSVHLARIPLTDHLGAYLDHLRAQNDTESHARLVESRCKKVLEGCKFVRWSELEKHALEVFLSSLRRTPRGTKEKPKPGFSIQTTNHYLQQFRSFVTWLAERMKASDPFAGMKPLNEALDRRHLRRSLTEQEFGKLVATTAASPHVRGRMNGSDRAMLYLVASYTGLRASELWSVAPEQVDLAGDLPTMTVLAGYSKRREEERIPLPPILVEQLRPWMKGRPAGQSLWPGKWATGHRAAEMLRGDLKEAGIAYKDVSGQAFDFHSLRGQFITGLSRAGVPLVHAQKLARHSTPTLTANYYTHLGRKELADQVKKLPPPPKTGTEG